MIFDPASGPHLKPWLVRTLEPICDAEPGALADYILALLKHNVPESEMRKELQVQLEEFLENECKPFIDTLFTVLRTKSYLPYSTNPPSPPSGSQDEGIPIPLDEIMGGSSAGPSNARKRSAVDDERDGRPSKGARLNAEGDFSRYGNGGAWAVPQMGQEGGMAAFALGMPHMGMGVQGGMNGRRQQGGYQPPGSKKGVCRDYHHHGFCARGDTCKYSHGEDAVIPSQLYPMNAPMMPFNYLYNMFNPAAPYDPNDSRMDIRAGGRQQQRAPILPRMQQEEGNVARPLHASGELPVIQDLTPKPEGTSPQGEQPPNNQQPQQLLPMQPHPMAMMPGFDPAMFGGVPPGGMPQFMGPPMDGKDYPGPSGHNNNQHSFRGGRGGGPGRGRGGGAGAGAGGFGTEASSFRPGRRGDKTLVVEKIPEDKLSLEQINLWFKKFGDVTNVAVDPRGSKALVSFATHEEARAAWKSEDAVFNNRFVKVFWHKPMEGHGQVGQRALAASATLVANLSAKDSTGPATASTSQPAAGPSTSSTASAVKKTSSQSAAAAALAAKQELLEKQITEQKSLMEELATATPERKKEIMARLRKLGEEMTAAKKAEAASTPPADSQKESGAADKDADMKAPEEASTEETTEQLKAKLERLKAEAASLGIAESADAHHAAGGYRGGFRGRGRGRGTFYRGGPPVMRGGPPRGSLKLDNRPKKLVVKGVKDGDTQHVKEWYESLGQVENIETLNGGEVLVSFKSRPAAEQGLAKGTHIPGVGKVQVTWHIGKPTTTTTTPITPASSAGSKSIEATPSTSMVVDKDVESVPTPIRERSPQRSVHDDEEVLISGWGGEDDGMGLL